MRGDLLRIYNRLSKISSQLIKEKNLQVTFRNTASVSSRNKVIIKSIHERLDFIHFPQYSYFKTRE